jgi:hypothetical protein
VNGRNGRRGSAIAAAVFSIVFLTHCGLDERGAGDIKVPRAKSETAYIAVEGMVQQLGIT